MCFWVNNQCFLNLGVEKGMPNSDLGNPVYQPNFPSCSTLLSELLSFCLWFRKSSCLGLSQGKLVRLHASNLRKLYMALLEGQSPWFGRHWPLLELALWLQKVISFLKDGVVLPATSSLDYVDVSGVQYGSPINDLDCSSKQCEKGRGTRGSIHRAYNENGAHRGTR